MKLTIMPGELSTKPLGIWPAAAPASTDLDRDGRVGEGLGGDRPGPGRALRHQRPSSSAGRHAARRPRSASAGRARGALRRSTCSPASARTSAGDRRGAGRAGRAHDRERRPAARGHGGGEARPGSAAPRPPCSSATRLLEVAALLDAPRSRRPTAQRRHELLRRRRRRPRPTPPAAASVLLPPPKSRPKKAVKASGMTRMKMSDSRSRRVSQEVLAGEDRGELHGDLTRTASASAARRRRRRRRRSRAARAAASGCRPAPPPRMAVSQPCSSQPLGVNCWTNAYVLPVCAVPVKLPPSRASTR